MRIATTPQAGDVAVHSAHGDGLLVLSVIADPAIAPARVHAAAHDLAGAHRRSLFDLPLGEGHAWTITETRVAGPTPEERYRAIVPAWNASSSHSLLRGGLGFDRAADALAALCNPEFGPIDTTAVQTAAASYTKHGFEAAALTALSAPTSALHPPMTVRRTAQLRFNRPYAVVAIAQDPARQAPGPWHGLPVFSAWVAEPSDAEE